MNTIKISPGDRYYDLLHDEALMVLNVSPRVNRLLVEMESGMDEARSLCDFVKRVRRGEINLLEEARPPNGRDEEQ